MADFAYCSPLITPTQHYGAAVGRFPDLGINMFQ